jgi:hypothetical protein
MKKLDLKKMHTSKKAFRSKLLTSFKRALRIGTEPRSTSNLQISRKGLPDTFLTHNEFKKINAQLLKMEMQKAEAIKLIREHNRCI